MCLHPHPVDPIPEETARVATAAFPKGTPYMTMRAKLGTIFEDTDVACLFPQRGQPALAPWRLALVTIMPVAEGLSDRQTAEAVRVRIDWQYPRSLDLADADSAASVVCAFRGRLLAGGSFLTTCSTGRGRWDWSKDVASSAPTPRESSPSCAA